MIIDETQVKATVYLFGCEPSAFKRMVYEDAVIFKAKAANLLLGRLYEAEIMSRDVERIRSVTKTIKLHEALIKEMK